MLGALARRALLHSPPIAGQAVRLCRRHCFHVCRGKALRGCVQQCGMPMPRLVRRTSSSCTPTRCRRSMPSCLRDTFYRPSSSSQRETCSTVLAAAAASVRQREAAVRTNCGNAIAWPGSCSSRTGTCQMGTNQRERDEGAKTHS